MLDDTTDAPPGRDSAGRLSGLRFGRPPVTGSAPASRAAPRHLAHATCTTQEAPACSDMGWPASQTRACWPGAVGWSYSLRNYLADVAWRFTNADWVDLGGHSLVAGPRLGVRRVALATRSQRCRRPRRSQRLLAADQALPFRSFPSRSTHGPRIDPAESARPEGLRTPMRTERSDTCLILRSEQRPAPDGALSNCQDDP
jgi:hypothetical protein